MNLHSKYLLLLILIMTTGVAGQSRVDCGNVPSGSLSIPSYKFVVVDKHGRQFEGLRAVGFVEMQTWVWGKGYGDGNWQDQNRFVAVPVTFDQKQGVYISKAVPALEVKDTGSRKYPCLDRLRRFYVGFTLGNEFNETKGYSAGYALSLWNKMPVDIVFPDAVEPIKITLKSWGGVKEP